MGLRRFFSRPGRDPTRHLPVAVAALLVVLLGVLAVFQWRWIGEVSALERQRMGASLSEAATRLAEDLDREVTRAFLYFHPEPREDPQDSAARVARQQARWQAEAPYPRLVRQVFLTRPDGAGRLALSVLHPAAGRFEPSPWPPELARLRQHLEAPPPPRDHGLVAFGPLSPVAPEVPALVLPTSFGTFAPPAPGTPRQAMVGAGGHVIVWLDTRVMAGELLPMLTRRYFGSPAGGDYALAVLDGARPPKAIFLSDPGLPAAAFARVDARVEILALRPFQELHALGGSHRPPPGVRPERWRRGILDTLEAWHRGHPPEPRQDAEAGSGWSLVVKRREGSLEAAVAAVRRRNLGISLGVLALLAATMALMVWATQRAQRLARQQIEFVAGVTHELNTPLTAIRSAGQNLADGITAEPAQVRRYGELIESEGRRLSDLLGQALEFAGIQSGRRVYHPRPVAVARIVDSGLESCRWLLAERGLAVEREIAPGLPPVLADAAALSRAVANLVENAAKHAGRGGWIGVRARRDEEGRTGDIEITVADRGPGIRREDLPRLFEPFFRGRDAATGGVPGSGLGLALVRHGVEAQGGRVTVTSEPGAGSAFTLHLPAAAGEEAGAVVEAPA